MVNSSCVEGAVIKAVGASAMKGVVLLDIGDPNTASQKEAQLYKAVMAKYAPKADPSGITPTGYLSMLGFVRAVNAGGLSGDATPATIATAIKAAQNVPLPIGDGSTFSCNATTLPSPQIKATICNSKFFVTTYDASGKPGSYSTIDAAKAFGG
jgi:branched-chain amino acid transport system substrate-binding protein